LKHIALDFATICYKFHLTLVGKISWNEKSQILRTRGPSWTAQVAQPVIVLPAGRKATTGARSRRCSPTEGPRARLLSLAILIAGGRNAPAPQGP